MRVGEVEGYVFTITDLGVADIVKTRSVESVRIFSRSSKGLHFKSTQIPPRRLAYSDLAESVKHISRGLQDIDNKYGYENEHIGAADDSSETVNPTSTENTNLTG